MTSARGRAPGKAAATREATVLRRSDPFDLQVIDQGIVKANVEERFTDPDGVEHTLQTTKTPFIHPATKEKALLGVALMWQLLHFLSSFPVLKTGNVAPSSV